MKKIFNKIASRLTAPRKASTYFYVIIPAVILNLLFSYFNNAILETPLFLDSIFTAVAAVFLGPAAGVLTGLLTNIGMEFVYGMTGLYWPFAVCNMATGFIVGTMNKKGYFKNILHMSIAAFLVAFTNAVLGAHIAFLLFRGDSGAGIDSVVSALLHMGQSMFSAVFWARIPANLADKLITILTAYSIKKWIFKDNIEFEYLLTKKIKEVGI
ncbi:MULTISPECIES: ECF transporter S component [unclassified Oceanispirochaeta]|uniref:ECF transporter S component n=1 Tax=unclassified Oceanispirochaeta TaxID=2635722 RepID=UPI000E094DFF|nr:MULTISPECIES: ECF transporter S component [unclassified Oceanispirochaeta]MBF9015894.1 ECF transporter S component [Oceanispirochaeta sp. M2]NPD72357.1 ECF transporter S component [Oceanispirochaeta sp. M1]RDG32128.1 ECF transporter S component [Oceanispirochaeta sp. M1]